MLQIYRVEKCPTDELSTTNCAIVNEREFPKQNDIAWCVTVYSLSEWFDLQHTALQLLLRIGNTKKCIITYVFVSYICSHVIIKVPPNHRFTFTTKGYAKINPGCVGLGAVQVSVR